MHRTRSFLRISTAVVAIGVTGVLGTACSSSPTAEENKAAACDAVADFRSAVDEARTSLSSTATVGEIREVRERLAAGYEDVTDSLSAVGQDRVDAIDQAWKSFDDAVADLDENLAVPDAAASLQEEIVAIDKARDYAGRGLTCA